MPKIASRILWPAWVLFTIAVTARPFLWHLEYYRHPGKEFFAAYLALLALLIVASFLYIRLRQSRPALTAWEPRIFFAFFLAFFLFYAFRPTLYSLLTLFVCFGLGRLTLGRLAESALEQLTLFPAAGLGIMSTLLFALGALHLLYRSAVLALLIMGALLLRANAKTLWDLLRRAAEKYPSAAADPLWGLCLIFLFVSMIASAMVVLSPEIAFDPVSFHFVLARDYALHHRLEIVPYFPYSYFPQGIEILYTLGFLLEGQITAKALTYAFFPLSAASVAMIGQRWFAESRAGALAAMAFFATTPFIDWTGSVAKNDLALALYLLLALYGAVRWTETRRFGWLAAAALFLGFGFGVKHVAILGAVPWALIVLWNWRSFRLRPRQAAALAAVFFSAGLYWHVRTLILTGNPLYPEATRSAVRSTTAAGHPQLTRLDRLGIYLSVPWRIHFRGLPAFESPSPNPCGFVVIAFLPLLFWPRRNSSPAARLVLVFCAIYFLYWAAILIKVRYAIAAFGALFACLGDRVCRFHSDRNDAFRRYCVLALAAYCLAFSLTLVLILQINVPRLELFARRINPDQFLRKTLVTYPSIAALNRLAQPGERAYSVGNCSSFYADVGFRCYYDAGGNYSLDQIRGELETMRYQYLLVSNAWAEPHHMHVIDRLFHPLLVYQDDSFRIYRLRRVR
ncbi:MAG TPA: glycosyltransferase family 39 protein [Bryobacterales bacterium]|jgi:4-amino-4-deoxy-L-arabinose transferase-like glycosyltransferase|nr:glycosyltransferase family 39 protein [Bryobacterales bacterium]